jgi:signal transduction histidine kinase
MPPRPTGIPPRTAAGSAAPHAPEVARSLEALSSSLAAVEPVATALRTGAPHREEFSDGSSLRAAGWPADLARALSGLAPGALCVLPLAVHERAAGALILVRGGGAGFGAEDVRLAGELAGRAALALEGALLHEQALRAARLRDDMVSVVSHDLRSPLSVISMVAAMLAEPGTEPPLSATRAKFVEMIRRSAEQMNQMVEDLLDVARIESGRLALQGRPLVPATVLAEAAQSLLPQADAAGIGLEVEAVDRLPEVWGDPDRLQRVFANLVGNALKFTPRGGRITLRAEPEGGAEVRFSVRDTGGGIPPEHLPYVFDRFWQASRSDRWGLGLGLPIVKGIVEAQGGRVWVESEAGRGSAFFFTLPTTPAAAAAA